MMIMVDIDHDRCGGGYVGEFVEEILEEVEKELREEVVEEVREEVVAGEAEKFVVKVREGGLKEILDKVRMEAVAKVRDEVVAEVWEEVREEVMEKVRKEIVEEVRARGRPTGRAPRGRREGRRRGAFHDQCRRPVHLPPWVDCCMVLSFGRDVIEKAVGGNADRQQPSPRI